MEVRGGLRPAARTRVAAGRLLAERVAIHAGARGSTPELRSLLAALAVASEPRGGPRHEER